MNRQIILGFLLTAFLLIFVISWSVLRSQTLKYPEDVEIITHIHYGSLVSIVMLIICTQSKK